MLRRDIGNSECLLRQQAAKGKFNAVQKILNENRSNSSFNINAQSSNGNTALHWACLKSVEINKGYSKKYSNTIKLLIQAGSDYRIKNNLGENPYHSLKEVQIAVSRSENFLMDEDSGEKDFCYFTLLNELLRIECAKITSPSELEGELASATAFHYILDSLTLFDFFPEEDAHQDTFTILSLACGRSNEILPLIMYFQHQNKKVNYIGIDNDSAIINKNKIRYADYENVAFICADASNLDEVKAHVSQSVDLGIMRNGDFTQHNDRQNIFFKIVDRVLPNVIKPEHPLLMTFQTEDELNICSKQTQFIHNFKKFKGNNFCDSKKLCFFPAQYLNRLVMTYPDRFSVILNLDKTKSEQALLGHHFENLRIGKFRR